MTIDPEKFHQTLESLHEQLQGADQLSPELETELRESLQEIQQVLQVQAVTESGEDSPASTEESSETVTPSSEEDDSSLRVQLDEAALYFKETHPTLSGTLTRLIDTLGQMGI